MLKKRLLFIAMLLAISGFETLSFATEKPKGSDLISGICSTPRLDSESPPSTPLSISFEKVQSDFNTEAKRVQNPEKFVDELDQVLAQSKFSYLLDCRDRLLHGPETTFEVKFQDPKQPQQNMLFGRDEETSTSDHRIHYSLSFNLRASVQMVLFVYMHELTHSCQVEKRKELDMAWDSAITSIPRDEFNAYWDWSEGGKALPANLSPEALARIQKLDEAFAAPRRFDFTAEMEAFLTMQEGYESFLPISSRLCNEEDGSDFKSKYELWKVYMSSADQIAKGHYPQRIISYYLNYYKFKDRWIFETSSSPVQYPDTYGEPAFSMHPLSPPMIDAVRRIGLKVDQSVEARASK